MSAARDLVKNGKAALATSVDGHAHLVMLEDYEGRPLKSGYTGHDAGHMHPWVMLADGTIRIGEQHGHTHAIDATSKRFHKQADDELGELLKSAGIITKSVGSHGHIVSLTDGSGALLTGGLTAQSADSGRAPHRHPWILDKSGRVVVGEAEGHTHDVDQAEASTLLRKLVKATVATAELGIPDEIPSALLDLSDEPEYDFEGDMTAEERRAAERRNAMRRDRAEREAALDPAGAVRTLTDLDIALETRARELAREGETVQQAFSRLVGGRGRNRDDEFAALLEERERVARLGAGYQGAAEG